MLPKLLMYILRGNIDVAPIVDKIRENRLRWFGRVIRSEEVKAVRAVMKMEVEGIINRGRYGWKELEII